jgi:APA family basic amino acid/polyamine antiporter
LLARQPLEWTTGSVQGPTLRRALGWPALTAIGLGTMLGGIFPTVGPGAMHAGPAVVLSFVLTGAICVAVALCYAEFASMVPVAGSAYTYAYATLGEIVAWIIGWDLILEYGLSVAPTASSWSSYAQNLLAQVGIRLPVWAQTAWVARGHFQVDVLASVITLLVTVLVAIGIRESARANATLVGVQIVAMIVFVVALVPFIHPANLHPFAPFGWHGVVVSASLVFFAYIGFDTVTVASEEAHRPERDVPIGIILSLIIGVILFCTIAYVTAGSLSYLKYTGDGGAAMTDAVAANIRNPWLIAVVGIGGIAGNFTVMLTSLLGQIRIFYVMARDRMLPPGVATIHPRFRTPARMTFVTGAVVAVLAAVLPLTDLLNFVNIGTLAAFAIVCAGVLVLRIVRPDARRPFKAPLAPIFTIFGALGCAGLTAFFPWPTWARFGIWFALGIAVYVTYGYRHSRLKGQSPG